MVGKVGSISKTVQEMTIAWKIAGFFSLSDSVDSRYYSPPFRTLGESWYLVMFPNGESSRRNEGWISIYLYIKQASCPLTIACSIGIKTAEGKQHQDSTFTYVFDGSRGQGFRTFLKRSKLVEKKDVLVPYDILTIICCLKRHRLSVVSRTGRLSRHLGFLLEDETNHDVTVRVEAEEFRLHRSILGARSPVFDAMFRHETQEKITGVVTIQDCRADIFRLFARYLYTGKVKKLSEDNSLDLFKLADKYHVKELADDCVQYIANMLTVDTFCEVVEVALNHGEESLVNIATDLLWDNMREIVNSERWQKFLLENPLRANELLKKACDKKR